MPFLLPQKYHFRHQYIFFLHDILAKIVKVGEKEGHFNQNIKLDNADHQEILKSKKQEETYDTLMELGYADQLNLLLFKQIFVAVLTDFLQYIYTALETAEKGKLSVTYSLLRKPFKDNLFILEWILSEPDIFLSGFKSTKSYEEIAIDNIKQTDKIRIIKIANDRTGIPFLNAEFIYELRYDKSKPYGFESMWQQATHIITTSKHYRTEEMNLNFVFSDYNAKISQWENLYFLMPGLMLYTVNICWTIYHTLQPKSKIIDENMLSRITVGYSICTKESVRKFDQSILKNMPMLCKKCGSEVLVSDDIENSIINKGKFLCPNHHQNNFFAL
jgi:hypothetical protein